MQTHGYAQDWHPHLIADVTPGPKRRYPYLVVQLAPSLFELWPVRFASAKDQPSEDVVVVPMGSRPRERLVAEARRRAASRDLPMAVVFGASDAVLVSPDGEAQPTDTPPRGGMRMVGISPPH